jgi:MFS family permease
MSSPLLVATSISTALTIGLVPALLRSLQAPLRERLQLSENRLDQLDKLTMFSWIPLMPLAGWLVEHWGLWEVLFTGSLALSLAVASFALMEKPAGLFWGVLGLGFAGACITISGVTLMPEALALPVIVPFGRGQLQAGGSVGASLSLGYVFVGLGSLVAPMVIAVLLRQLDFRRTVLSLALLSLLPALFVVVVKLVLPAAEVPLADGDSLYDIRFWLIAAVVMLYVPLEQALAIWPRPYLREIGFSGQAIARLLVGFWCAFLLFRFGFGWLVRPGNEAWLVLVSLLASSMVLGNLAGAYAASIGYVGFCVVGAFYGPILPALLATLASTSTRRIPGQTLGAVFGLSALASLIAQPLWAAYAKKHGPRELMRVPILLGLVTAALVLVLAVVR